MSDSERNDSRLSLRESTSFRGAKDDYRIAIVGGGLAGLAAAVALAGRGFRITLFESRRQLGGRAGSFRDPATGEAIDHCQHVGLGCCTAWRDLCRRTGLEKLLREEGTLHFVLPGKGSCEMGATPWLPAPLHLATSFLRYPGLTFGEIWSIGRTLDALASLRVEDDISRGTIGAWLQARGESANAMRRFWGVVLTSALSESLDRASVAAARKVFVDGFLATTEGYRMIVPRVPLSELYDQLSIWLTAQGVEMRRSAAVKRIEGEASGATGVTLVEGVTEFMDAVISAVPWHQAAGLMSESLREALPELTSAARLESAPITAVHLWFDRPLSERRHAVVIDRLTQWVFRRDESRTREGSDEFYYQAVISNSRGLAGRPREEIVAEVIRDLGEVWRSARRARLLRSRVVTQHDAVFSPLPGSDALRPIQATRVPNLFLAGDWTATGWPATMESAVRSGYLAANALLAATGRRDFIEIPEPSPGWIAKWMEWK